MSQSVRVEPNATPGTDLGVDDGCLNGEGIDLPKPVTGVSDGTQSPYEHASWFGVVMFTWMNSLIATGAAKIIEFEDVDLLPKEYSSPELFKRLDAAWTKSLQKHGKEGTMLSWCLFQCFWFDFFCGSLFMMPYIIVVLLQPYFVLHLLFYIVHGHTEFLGIENPLVLSVLLGVLSIISSITWSVAFHFQSTAGIRVRGAVMAALFVKALKLSTGARGRHTTGEILTLLSSDVERLWQAALYVNWLWLSPALFIAAMVLLYLQIGVSAVAAVGGLLVVNYIQTVSGNRTGLCRREMVKFTDARVKVTNEILQGIRVIKYYAWELPMLQKVTDIRRKEIGHLVFYQGYKLINSLLAFIGPSIVSFAMFICFSLLGGVLSIPLVYSALAFLNIIRMPLNILPNAYAHVMEALEAFTRLTKFLQLEEVQELNRIELPSMNPTTSTKAKAWAEEVVGNNSKSIIDNSSSNKAVIAEIRNGYFLWDSHPEGTTNKKQGDGEKEEPGAGAESNICKPPQSISPPSIVSSSSPSMDADLSITLADITLRILEGEFVAVVGSVGAGKSSLVSALLEQMCRVQGTQYLHPAASVALVSQDHWIQNMSLMENVLFGKELNEAMYADVLDASQLSQDILSLPHGDLTSIGERGINLSGGQKARVSIARALYSLSAHTQQQDGEDTKHLFIFDDPLAAVDVHVGKAIFNHAFKTLLRQHTRIVCLSSNYHFLPDFDRIAVLKRGKLVAFGTFPEVVEKFPEYAAHHQHKHPVEERASDEEDETSSTDEDGDHNQEEKTNVNEWVVEDLAHHDSNSASKGTASMTSAAGTGAVPAKSSAITSKPPVSQYRTHLSTIREKRKHARAIMTEEERERGSVSLGTFISYFDSAAGIGWGGLAFVGVLLLFALGQTGRTIGDMWVGQWAIHGTQHIHGGDHNTYLDMFFFNWFIILLVGTIGLSLLRGAAFMGVCIYASLNLHEDLLLRVMRAAVNTYFDVTPLGRIINKFSKDLDNVDSLLPDFFVVNLQNTFQCIFIFVVCVTITPFILVVLAPTFLLFYRFQRYFRATSRELKRLDGMSRSPLYSLFSETLNGIISIRAYDRAPAFTLELFRLADQQTRNFFVFYYSNRWLAIRFDLISSVVLLSVALLATGLASAYNKEQETGHKSGAGSPINPNYLGLALVYSLQLTGLLQWTVRTTTETETNMTSVERLLAFQNVKPEEPALSNDDWKNDATGAGRKRTSSSENKKFPSLYAAVSPTEAGQTVIDPLWPCRGAIRIRNMRMRYRPELGLVIKGMNLNIPGGKRVGVCGRTGAGKSSLMLALFRIVTTEPESMIHIDGVDIGTLSLRELRSALTIIPQDPVMFSGTLRTNLDPFNKHSDAELWECLERAHLKDDVMTRFPKKLEHEIAESGSNISIGQRQLVCIARALLRRSKVIVMDEATAAVDTHTDGKIQASIRENFNTCTLLTIAHRLETIADFDLVCVLDAGRLGEVGSPHYLLTCDESQYSEPSNQPPAPEGADVPVLNAPSIKAPASLSAKQQQQQQQQPRPYLRDGEDGECVVEYNCKGMFKGLVSGLGPRRQQHIREVAKNQHDLASKR